MIAWLLPHRLPGRVRRRLVALPGDRRGVTVVEFAMIAPVMGLLLLGAFDLGHSLYLRAALQGVVQKIGRDSSLETGTSTDQQALLDQKVRDQVKALVNNAQVFPTRRYYRTFSDAAQGRFEPFTDTDRNGTCNNGEPYEDNNNNSRWDSVGGNDGAGGAKDAVLYSVRVEYKALLPINKFLGGTGDRQMIATTVLRNQPYGDQAPPVLRNCT